MSFRFAPLFLTFTYGLSFTTATCGDPVDTPTPTPPVESNTEQIAVDLEAAVDGLYFMSESDFPFEVVVVEGAAQEPLTADNIKEAITPVYVNRPEQATLEERFVEVRTLDQFFYNLTTPQPWWDDYYYEQAEWYADLEQVMREEVIGAQYFRLGEQIDDYGYVSGSVDIYLVGASNVGDLVGVWTISIET